MTVSAIPALIDALVTLSTDRLPTHLVSDGFHTSDDVGDFLEVGIEDPELTGFTTSADSTHEYAHAGSRVREENGNVACAALSWDPDGDAKAARDAAFGTAEAVAAMIAEDPTLGVPGILWTTFGDRVELHHGQTEDGAVAQVLFRVAFKARIQ